MPKPTNDTKLEVLNDHYKETVADFKKTGKSRDTYFVILLVLLGVMSFQFVSPTQSQSILTQLINAHFNIDASLSINLLGSLIWLALLFAALRYFQTVINLEKQYNYSHELEEELSKNYKEGVFTREGKSYLKDYPIFSDWVHLIYRTLFPILLVAILTLKLIAEWRVKNPSVLPLVLDTFTYLLLIISVVLYMYSLHKTEKHTEKDLKKSNKTKA